MKKVTQSLLALLLAALPVTSFAAASDVLFSQKNTSNTAWANVIVAPTASSALAFDSSKVPISTQALTLSSITAPASTNLTLTSGLVGTNKVRFPDTLSASSSIAGAIVVGDGATAATNVAIGGGNINAGGSLTIGNTFNFDTGAAAGTRSINLGSTFGSGTWTINNGTTAIGAISSSGFSSNVGFRAPVGGGPTAVDYGWSGASGLYSPTANNISIANNNARVANFSTTALTLDYTTAGSAGAGALVVAGGIYAGAASVLTGLTTTGLNQFDVLNAASRALIVGPVAQSGGNLPYATIKTSASFADFALNVENTNSTSGQGLGLRIVSGSTASDLPLYVRDRTNATTLFSVGGTGAATFADAVTAASLATTQTPSTAVSVVSTHKVPIVLNGATYYILLTNVP